MNTRVSKQFNSVTTKSIIQDLIYNLYTNSSVISSPILEHHLKTVLTGHLAHCTKLVLIVLTVIYMLWCFTPLYSWDTMVKMVYQVQYVHSITDKQLWGWIMHAEKRLESKNNIPSRLTNLTIPSTI